MLLKCEYTFINRLAPGSDVKRCHATISVGKKKKSYSNEEEVFFVVHTAKNKSGTKFQIRNNLIRVHSRLINEGKCTICLKDPPYDLIISKAAVDVLKKFLVIVKLAFKGEDTGEHLNNILQPKNADLEKPKTSMKILSKEQYPIRTSFPTSLETLIVNFCSLKKFDSRFLRLVHLKTLDLSKNNLSTLCDSLDDLKCLKCVYLQENQLKCVPACLIKGETANRIQLLDLSSNQIEGLPNRITSLKNIVTLKLDNNQIQYLPNNIGQLQQLQFLHISNNKLKFLPWSFVKLHLGTLDISENLFHEELGIEFRTDIEGVPSLFELSSRYIVNKRITVERLPLMLQQRLESVKFCPCGGSCFTNCIPYVKTFNTGTIAHTVYYDISIQPKMIGFLCSKNCYLKWLANPNALFTRHEKIKK